MAQGLRLELRQHQQLVMTPQLQQAIRLLQMSNLELQAFVEREIETNPLIELDAGERDTDADGGEDGHTVWASDGDTAPGDNPARAAEVFDTGAENLFDDETARPTGGPSGATMLSGPAAAARGGSGGTGFDNAPPETQIAAETSLHEHLERQIGQMRAEPGARRLACLLVRNLDENGWLQGDLDELAEQLGLTRSPLEAALRLLQQCEPAGVGARGLAECLALQLADRGRLDPAMRTMLGNLELLARGEHRRLRQLCRVDTDRYESMVRTLRSLDPRPGAAFVVEPIETLVPDVLMRRTPSGAWHLELNPDTLPRVLIDHRYASELSRGGEEVRSWLAERRQQASWLVRSLDQRARTILRVATAIVRHQEAFFEHGIAALRPLTLRTIAEETGLHESTASRVTANKFIATERGIFELRFFFTNALGGAEDGSDGVAAEAVRHRIRALVEAEDPVRILSDDTIAERLQGEGIDIARRTVAKYRKSLKIPSSVARRRLKTMGG